jgi:hypothetical protein
MKAFVAIVLTFALFGSCHKKEEDTYYCNCRTVPSDNNQRMVGTWLWTGCEDASWTEQPRPTAICHLQVFTNDSVFFYENGNLRSFTDYKVVADSSYNPPERILIYGAHSGDTIAMNRYRISIENQVLTLTPEYPQNITCTHRRCK